MQSNSWPVTFSIGVVSADASRSTLPELLDAADRLIYQAKRAGSDRTVRTADFGVKVVGDSGSI